MNSKDKIELEFQYESKLTESGVEKVEGLHDKRRMRMRQRFVESGSFIGFQPHEVLEMMLYSSVQRRDTNVIAHRLLNQFGTLQNVLNTDILDLTSICGMTENAAVSLKIFAKVTEYIAISSAKSRPSILTLSDAVALAHAHIGNKDEEHLFAIFLDSSQRVLRKDIVERGSPDTVSYFGRSIIKLGLNAPTVSVILSHNHPSNMHRPSEEDYIQTERLATMLSQSGLELADHIIVTPNPNNYFSFRRAGLLYSFYKDNNIVSHVRFNDAPCFAYANETAETIQQNHPSEELDFTAPLKTQKPKR